MLDINNNINILTFNFIDNHSVVSYESKKYFLDFGNNTSSTDTNPIAHYTTIGNYKVTLVVHNAEGCSDTLTLPIARLNYPGFFIYIPSAFTPGHDNLNDTFRPIMSKFYTSFSMYIYNKWGQKVFETYDPEKGWDGRYNGEFCPPGAYVYYMHILPINGQPKKIKNTILLLR